MDPPPQLDDVRLGISKVADQLSTISSQVASLAKDSSSQPISGLKAALYACLAIAFSIRGPVGVIAIHQVDSSTVSTAARCFQEVRQNADDNLTKIGTCNATVAELRSGDLAKLQAQLDVLSQLNQNSITTAQSKIDIENAALQTLQNTIQTDMEAISQLQSKIEDLQTEEILLGILCPLALIAMLQNLMDSQIAIESQQASTAQDVQSSMAQMDDLLRQKASLDQQVNSCQQTDRTLSSTKTQANNLESTSSQLQASLVGLQAIATGLDVKMGHISNLIENASINALTKSALVTALLDICHDSLIDKSLVDAVSQLEGEMIANYGSALPDDVATAKKALDDRVDAVNQGAAALFRREFRSYASGQSKLNTKY